MNKKNKAVISIAIVLIVFGIIITAVATVVETKKAEAPVDTTERGVTEQYSDISEVTPPTENKIPEKNEEVPIEPETPAPAGNGKYLGTYKITGTGGELNVRSEPSTESNKVTTIPENATVEIVAIYDDWGFIKKGNDYGWISLEYANMTAQKSEAGQGAGTYKVSTENDPLSIRDLPDETSSVAITSMPKGETVNVVAIYGDWAYVDYNGTLGWSSLKYLTKQ